MSSSTIQLPANFSDNITAVASNQLSNFSPYVIIIVGILLAIVVISFFINSIKN